LIEGGWYFGVRGGGEGGWRWELHTMYVCMYTYIHTYIQP
jgi:hypothetical protein